MRQQRCFLCYRASVKEKVEGTERERERMGGPWCSRAGVGAGAGAGVGGDCVLLLPDSVLGDTRGNGGK